MFITLTTCANKQEIINLNHILRIEIIPNGENCVYTVYQPDGHYLIINQTQFEKLDGAIDKND